MPSVKDDVNYREQIRLKAKNDFNQDLTEEQIDMCIYTEEQEKLSFFHGHLYLNPRKMQINNQWVNKIQWSKSIDGYRVLAQRNRLCRVDEPVWENDKDGNLYLCKVSVWRRGPDGYPEGPFVGIAHYHEFVQMTDEYEDGKKTGKKRPNRQWQVSPMNQLSVCAERQAHRKAGLDHTNISEDIVDVHPEETVDEIESIGIHEPDTQAPTTQFGSIPFGVLAASKAAAPSKPNDRITLEYSKAHRGFEYQGAMIVMTVAGPKWHSVLLDNGKCVVFGREGNLLVEQKITDREFEFAGGSEWIIGSVYYDKSKVTSVVSNGRNVVLELDSGVKVKLDEWGKELGRKAIEVAEPASEVKLEPEPQKDAETSAESDYDKAILLAKDCSGAPYESLRKATLVLLAFWCKNLNGGVKVSPKTAYIELLGVAIGEGDSMRQEDYRALLETLYEKIEERAA